MKASVWWGRVWNALLAGLAGWLAGVVLTIPFEIGEASRYVAGRSESLLGALAGGMLVWGTFALFMASIAWTLLVLPVALLLPPRWIVRLRLILVPASVLAATLALGLVLHVFERENFASIEAFLRVFWIAPNIFAMAFAGVLTAVYAQLEKKRLASHAP